MKKNDQEARNIDVIFSKKQEKENKVEELKVQLESKRMAVEDVIGNMEEDVLRRYQTMTVQSEKIRKVRNCSTLTSRCFCLLCTCTYV